MDELEPDGGETLPLSPIASLSYSLEFLYQTLYCIESKLDRERNKLVSEPNHPPIFFPHHTGRSISIDYPNSPRKSGRYG